MNIQYAIKEVNTKEEVQDYIKGFLNREFSFHGLRLNDSKILEVVQGKHSAELVLSGEYSREDAVKNLIAYGQIDKTTLLKINTLDNTLLIGTHNREDEDFNSIKEVLKTIVDKDVIHGFNEVDVTEKDFIGKNIFIASTKYPTNKMSRYI